MDPCRLKRIIRTFAVGLGLLMAAESDAMPATVDGPHLFALAVRPDVGTVDSYFPMFVINPTEKAWTSGGTLLRFQLERRQGKKWVSLGLLGSCGEVGCDVDNLLPATGPRTGHKILFAYPGKSIFRYMFYFRKIPSGAYRIRSYPQSAGARFSVQFESTSAPTPFPSVAFPLGNSPLVVPAAISTAGDAVSFEASTVGTLNDLAIELWTESTWQRVASIPYSAVGTNLPPLPSGESSFRRAAIDIPPLPPGMYRIGPPSADHVRAVFWVFNEPRLHNLTGAAPPVS